MKLRVTFKDPDGVDNALHELASEKAEELQSLAGDFDLGEDPYDRIKEGLGEVIKPWVQYGEYVTIEIDTVAKTAVVIGV